MKNKFRNINYEGKKYKWKTSNNLKKIDGMIYVDVIVIPPNGKKEIIVEECLGDIANGIKYPITPETIRNIIAMYNL